MNELLNLLRYIPRPGRWLIAVFALSGAAYAVSRLLGLKSPYSWIPLIVVLVFCGLFALIEALRKGREKKRSREFEAGLGLNSRRSEVGKEEVREALAELSDKWQGAVAQLRGAGMSIYSLPWYLLIGEPQSGKSTTLVNSGLEFPVGAEALSGAGGTRNCDWWFSNEAVILDTAGRFTFQEESAPDQQEWSAFLKLLRKQRKLCPINGAIVVIPATSLVEDPPEEQEKKAKNIRQKLLQLQKDLEIRFPVFILITKADRVLGFTEFFSKLDPVDQRQLFGWSNSGAPEEAWDLKSFSAIFDDMVDRVHKLRMRLLKDEGNLPLLDKLFVFPEEFQELKEPLANYFQTIFAVTRFEEPFLFRGFYLTSGVQQGRPIARACRDLLRVQVGDPQAVLEDLEQVFQRSRAFFIRDFYEKKVFPEKGLIARTRAALKKDSTYRRVMYGLTGTLAVLSVLLLVLGGFSLFNVVAPVKKTATAAGECLDRKRAQPCEIGHAYDLIQQLERNKQTVREAKWTMRTFLRSSERNEISQTQIPAIQAELFQRNVLAPLLATVETRAQGLDWTQHAKDYDTFYDAFAQLLRFRRMAGATASDDVSAVRQELRIGPLLAFCKATPGRDPQGKVFDDWLRSDLNLEQADKIFRDAMSTKPDLTRLAVPKGENALIAFRDYWTINNLARWDSRTDEFLRTYKALYEEMLGLAPPSSAPLPAATVTTAASMPSPAAVPAALPPLSAPPAATPGAPAPAAPVPGAPPAPSAATAALAHFSDLAQRFAKNYTDGEAHMRTERQSSSDRRPGPVANWEANCKADFQALTLILPVARPEEISAQCGAIPVALNALGTGRQQYAYLFQTHAEGPKTVMGWSTDAARIKDPLIALGNLAAPQQAAADAQAFQAAVDAQQGSAPRLAVINSTYVALGQKVLAPVTALQELTGALPATPVAPASPTTPGVPAPPAAPPQPVSPAFRLPEGIPGAKSIASLALAVRVLPPAEKFFTSNEAFGPGCADCYYLQYAQDHVPPANDFLRWARLTMGGNQPEVSGPIGNIQTAEINYLTEAINRAKGGGGGGGGGAGGGGGQSFVTPARAGQVSAWRDFVREIRRWEPVIDRPAGGGGGGGGGTISGGITSDALARFVEGNDALRPLLSRMRDLENVRAARAAKAAAKPVERLSPDLVSTAETYKRCISGLEEDALKAWKQLALGKDGVSLADFHAFSSNLRLRGNPSAAQMATLEHHAADLLTQEIRPAFEGRLRNLWNIAGSCCNDRFPFISPARLQGLQESYRRGPGPAAGSPWAQSGRDTGTRTVTDVLQLDTVTLRALDSLFFAGSALDSLFEDFAVDPIVDGREKSIDFVGGNKDRLRVLRQWQRFVYGEGHTSAAQQVKVKLVSTASTAPRIFVGQRMSQIDLFGHNPVRPSTDAGGVHILNLPLTIDDRPATVSGRNEDKSGGWTGVLSLRGDALKIPYLVHLASDGRPRENGKVWTVRLQLPDYQQPQQRLEGIFELTFERPLPEIVPGAQINGF